MCTNVCTCCTSWFKKAPTPRSLKVCADLKCSSFSSDSLVLVNDERSSDKAYSTYVGLQADFLTGTKGNL